MVIIHPKRFLFSTVVGISGHTVNRFPLGQTVRRTEGHQSIILDTIEILGLIHDGSFRAQPTLIHYYYQRAQ